MGSNLPTRTIAELPLYQDGFNAGRDVGLVTALNIITNESARLDRDVTTDPRAAACMMVAAAELSAVARRIAATFRNQR